MAGTEVPEASIDFPKAEVRSQDLSNFLSNYLLFLGGDPAAMGGAGRLPDLPKAVEGEAKVLLLRRPALRHGPPPLRAHPRRHHQGHRHQVRHTCPFLQISLVLLNSSYFEFEPF